nr:reverse transcriptase domain-containing protein [Tanacetum cinerariifolium]
GNDLKTYARRFQELAVLCPNMVPNNEKRMEFFIGALPRSIEGNVTASKPQTLEEAINIAQRFEGFITQLVLNHGQRPKLYTKVKSDFEQPSSGLPFRPPFSNHNELVDHPIDTEST